LLSKQPIQLSTGKKKADGKKKQRLQQSDKSSEGMIQGMIASIVNGGESGVKGFGKLM